MLIEQFAIVVAVRIGGKPEFWTPIPPMSMYPGPNIITAAITKAAEKINPDEDDVLYAKVEKRYKLSKS